MPGAPDHADPAPPSTGPGFPHARAGDAWVLDLDGVVWLSGEPIPGAGDAVGLLRAAGARVLFASNNSSPTVEDLRQRLRAAGIRAEADEILTSAQAAASMLQAGATALVVGDDGVMQALAARGVHAKRAAEKACAPRARVDAVVVGYTERFDYEVLRRAADAVRAGARLIGTNEDATLPTAEGPLPGAGAILAAVVTASGSAPEVAGKPHGPLADLVAGRAGHVAAVVGDRPSTDGALARRLGAPFALVLSGVTAKATDDLDPAPDFVGDDLLAVAREATR